MSTNARSRVAMRAVTIMFVMGVLAGLSSGAEPDAATITTATGIRSGLAVTVPATDGRLESQLAAGARMLVHSLALDETAVDRARSAIARAKLTGVATIERTTALPLLPYLDRGVNLLVVDLDALGDKAPSADELLRVLAPEPNGAAYVKTGGKWEVRRKPLPKTARGWTTSGAESASGSYVNDDHLSGLPNTLQWANPPVGGCAGSASLILAEGYAFWCEGGTRSYKTVDTDVALRVWCADVFSGVVRWKLDVNEVVVAVADGLLITDELFTGLARTRNAATGELIVEHTEGLRSPVNSRELRKDKNFKAKGLNSLKEGWVKISDGVVVQNHNRDLVALDARTGKVLWKKKVADGRFDKTAIDQGAVIALVTQDKKSDGMQYMWGLRTVGYELKTGKELWTNPAVADRPINAFMARHGIVFACSDMSPSDTGFFRKPITYFNQHGGGVAQSHALDRGSLDQLPGNVRPDAAVLPVDEFRQAPSAAGPVPQLLGPLPRRRRAGAGERRLVGTPAGCAGRVAGPGKHVEPPGTLLAARHRRDPPRLLRLHHADRLQSRPALCPHA